MNLSRHFSYLLASLAILSTTSIILFCGYTLSQKLEQSTAQPQRGSEILATVTNMSTVTPTPSPINEHSAPTTPSPTSKMTPHPTPTPSYPLKILKDVGEPYLDHFGLNNQDFEQIQQAGFHIIESNFDICAYDEDVNYFLTQSYQNGLQVILNAGAGKAEWGYTCDRSIPSTQKPVWQTNKVQAWINKWKSHPAVYAWDISNEAGTNFPNGNLYRLTLPQLQQVYRDVKSTDPNHPVMIRMNGWYFYNYQKDFFRQGNPFGKNMADIIMINTYSNVKEYFPDFVSTVMSRAQSIIHKISPQVEVICALGIWEELPLWHKPSVEQLNNDFEQLKNLSNLLGTAYFKYGASLKLYALDLRFGDATLDKTL